MYCDIIPINPSKVPSRISCRKVEYSCKGFVVSLSNASSSVIHLKKKLIRNKRKSLSFKTNPKLRFF